MPDFLVLVFVGGLFFFWLMGPTLSKFGRACDVLKERRCACQTRPEH